MALNEYWTELHKALDGLTPDERRFQPSVEANHIDFVVWHMARVEDDWIQRFASRTDTIWQRDHWHEKLGLSKTCSGFGYTVEQVTTMPLFDFDTLMTYYKTIRQTTFQYLDDLTQEDINKCPQPKRRPGYTIGRMFSHIIVEESQHVGQVAYLRGLHRGINK